LIARRLTHRASSAAVGQRRARFSLPRRLINRSSKVAAPERRRARRPGLRPAVSVVIGLLSAFAIAATYAPAPASAAREAKVVIVVGPTGDVTSAYRALAEDAAAAAASMGSRVVRIYSPYATWPAVRAALHGASVVVYLGHGNGWPSRYRDSAWPYSQNGMGLNPVAGLNDDEHQYFGEFYLARDIKLAPGAVVLLTRLCYASGNSEPGLPEGTLDVARQRVDNYAAGWIKAGARAVIADAFTSPAYYVRALLASRQRVESIWRGSPNDRGHQIRFQSARSPGHVLQLDPDRTTGGFYRSLVDRSSAVHARGVPAGQSDPGPSYSARDPEQPLTTSFGGIAAPATVRQPTLAEAGFRFGPPALAKPPTAGRPVSLFVPVTMPTGRELPGNMTGAVRWDPLQLATPPAAPVPLGPADGASSTGRTSNVPRTGNAASGTAVLGPIVPEVLGQVVLTQLVQPVRGGVVVPLGVPSLPGLYRLTVLLANNQGQALSEGKEPLIPAQLVRVASPLAASYRVKSDVSAPAGANVALPITVINSGSVSWKPEPGAAAADRGSRPTPAIARLTAHWIGLDQSDVPVRSASVSVGSLAPGQSVEVILRLRSPDVGGQYALVLDVMTPTDGSIVASGADPGLVRVTVRGAGTGAYGGSGEGSRLP
jgi:hypothetical protein